MQNVLKYFQSYIRTSNHIRRDIHIVRALGLHCDWKRGYIRKAKLWNTWTDCL